MKQVFNVHAMEKPNIVDSLKRKVSSNKFLMSDEITLRSVCDQRQW